MPLRGIREAGHCMHPINRLLHLLRVIKWHVELPDPLAQGAEAAVVLGLHHLQGRLLVLPDLEVRREGLQGPRLLHAGPLPGLGFRQVSCVQAQRGVPHPADAILHRGVGDELVAHLVQVLLLGQQNARPGVPGDGFQIRLVIVEETALALDHPVALELVLQVFAGGAVGRAEVVDVRHVVEDLDLVDIDLPQMVQLPVHGVGRIPGRQVGRLKLRRQALGIVPHHHAAHQLADRVGTNRQLLWAGALLIGNLLQLPVGAVLPAVVGAADGVALDVRTGLHDMRRGAFGQVGAHVPTVGIQHGDTAGFPPVQHVVLAKEGDGNGG